MPLTTDQKLDAINAWCVKNFPQFAPPWAVTPDPVPTPAIGANPVTGGDVASSPRPKFAPGGHTLIKNLDKASLIYSAVNIVAGGKTIGPDGREYPSAGYCFQISADNCTIKDCAVTVPFSEYFLYVRPGVKNALVDNCLIRGGTNFEASIRNAGGDLTLRNVTVIQDHTGIDAKKSRTLVRGYGNWTIENSVFAGGTFGLTPMSRGNAGQAIGFYELHRGRGSGDMNTSEGGQMLVTQGHPKAIECTEAAVKARAEGKTRRDIVRAAWTASGIKFGESDIDDTLWNRDRMLAQRSTAVVRNCRFEVSPDGVPCTINITAGTSIQFIDCWADPKTIFTYEWQYPEDSQALPGSTNRNWVLPGDVIRPVPMVRTDRFTVGDKAYAAPERATQSIS